MPHESRSSELDLYKALIGEVNKAVDRSGDGMRVQLREGLDALDRKADSNYRALSERVNANRELAQEESLRVESKIDDIRNALSEGNARFAVIEQRIAMAETARRDGTSSHRLQGHQGQAPSDSRPNTPPPAPAEKGAKLSFLSTAILGAAAATFGGALVTWVINGGLTVSPRTPAVSAPHSP